ncbi:MAG: formyltetrahydrofolate deformylase [Syntrophobacterales bacterium]|jgi:formyltetrahydrofolate deformylase|nr:formyltetrahydrofolate deformylase [Syntrophobacterales bacterium]
MNSVNAILLLSCPDQKGLVATVSNFVFQHNGNIIHADQHTSQTTGLFFMRLEWNLDHFDIPREEIGEVIKPLAEQFGMTWHLQFSDYVPRIALFVSRHVHCFHDLILRKRMGEFKADIPLVISNHPELIPLIEHLGVHSEYIPITPETKLAQEDKELALLKEYRIDFVVLARYMQILSGKFVSAYPHRIINIHHSFLPAFAGSKPYQQAYDRGVKIIGATSHYVTEILDDGPIIAQDVTKISHRDSVEDIMLKGKDLERIVLARAVRLHAENRILVHGSKTVIFE